MTRPVSGPWRLASLAVAAVWLLLQPQVGVAQLLVALVLGIGLPRLLAAFLRWSGPGMAPPSAGGPKHGEAIASAASAAVPLVVPPRPGMAARLGLALRLAAVVALDIALANLRVAAVVLWPWSRPQPAWIAFPLTLRDPGGVSLLASIVTMTPGTVSCVIDEAHGRLWVHALDAPDPAAVVDEIRTRYEQPLRRLYGR